MKAAKLLFISLSILIIGMFSMSMMSCTKEVRVEVPSGIDTVYVHDTIYVSKPVDPNDPSDPNDPGKKPEVPVGNTNPPSDWSIPASVNLYPSAMYIVMDNKGVPVELEDGDLLAAFIDNECHGVTKAVTGTDGYIRFNLKVNVFQGEENRNDMKVELRFYSYTYKRIFKASAIPFEEDAILGKLYDGYKPEYWSY